MFRLCLLGMSILSLVLLFLWVLTYKGNINTSTSGSFDVTIEKKRSERLCDFSNTLDPSYCAG